MKIQSEEIESLKLKYHDLEQKLQGGHNNPVLFERKLQTVQRELRNDMENLRAQFRNNLVSPTSSYSSPVRYQSDLSHSLTMQ